MEEEDSDVVGSSEGGGGRSGDCAAGENNMPMGSNNRVQQRGRRAEYFFPDAP